MYTDVVLRGAKFYNVTHGDLHRKIYVILECVLYIRITWNNIESRIILRRHNFFPNTRNDTNKTGHISIEDVSWLFFFVVGGMARFIVVYVRKMCQLHKYNLE